jgi:hypothetical protein
LVRAVISPSQSVMLMRMGVAKPLEARKFIVFSRQYLGNTEREVIELWKSVMVGGARVSMSGFIVNTLCSALYRAVCSGPG